MSSNEDQRAEIQPVDIGFVVAIAPKTVEYMEAMSRKLAELTRLRLSPAVSFFAIADAMTQAAVPQIYFEERWDTRVTSKDFVEAVASHVLQNRSGFESLREFAWHDSHGFFVALIGDDEVSLRKYAREWSEEQSPLALHHLSDTVEITYNDGQIHLTEAGMITVQHLAEVLSELLEKQINPRQALFSLVQDNVQVAENPVSKSRRKVVIQNVLGPSQVTRCAKIIEQDWSRYSKIH